MLAESSSGPVQQFPAPMQEVVVNGTPLAMMIDSGATEVVIDEPAFESIQPMPALTGPSKRLFPFGEAASEVSQVGEFEARLEANGITTHEVVRVVSGACGCLLSHSAARRLDLYQGEGPFARARPRPPTQQSRIAAVANDAETFKRAHPSVFCDKVGKLKNFQVHLFVDDKVQPKQQACRRIPFHLVQAVDREIDRLLEHDVWEPVEVWRAS